ncbi:MAG: sulfatase-like hydrolase/transferase [Labilithrix sp.]|nr:sulfatase-like hydrolase/transferase [Labilithrix sp.]
MRFASAISVCALAVTACSRGSDAPSAAGSAAVPLAARAAEAAPAGPMTVLDFSSGFDGCTLSHRGALLDLGDPTMRARMSGSKLTGPDVETREHQGATWASVHDRSLELSFVSAAEVRAESGVVVEARVRGGVAKSASVYLNGKALGTLPLVKDEAKVVSVRATGIPILKGANELLVRLNGGARASRDHLAEIDWIRVGPVDGDAAYAAPTRADALTTVNIGGVARRGLSLRAPGSARCSAFVPNGAVLEGHIGVTGGEAEAEVRVLVDRAEPRVVGSFHLGVAGDSTPAPVVPWRPISLPLGDVGTLASVEIVAKSSTKGARVVFAEPRVVVDRPAEATKPPRSRGVVLVVLGSVAGKKLSAYGGPTPTAELAQIASAGTVFDAHRAATSFANGALASMLTGASPREHGVLGHEAALAPSIFTIAEGARQGGVATAMFTANPTTGLAHGFGRGFETFASRSPADEAPATAVFEDAQRWLDAHKSDRFLVVVHARGGHPPWDVTADEMKELAPAGYSGNLDPKHAAELLSRVKRGGGARLFGDADRERAFAMHDKAVLAHDAALGRLVSHLRSIGRENDTTLIVTGDVGIDAGSSAPFIEDDALDESILSVPLVIKAPPLPARPAHVTAPTTSVDLARTMLEALGLTPPPQLRGESLWRGLEGDRGPSAPRVATTATRFSARWSGFVLSGTRDRETKLCNLSLEPDCVSDVRATHPIAAEILHAVVFDELGAKPRAAARAGALEPAEPKAAPPNRVTPDAPTAAALRVWGAGAR